MFFSIKYRHFLLLAFMLVFPVMMMLPEFGCEPISFGSSPTDFDRVAPVNGFVAPDSVVIGELFNVQVSYKMACNEQFVKLRLDGSAPHFIVTPIVHRYPDQECSGGTALKTSTDTLRINDTGADTIIISGQDFALTHYTTTATFVDRPALFRFHFLFRDSLGGRPNYSSTFQRMDGTVVKSFRTDSLGYWDTLFTDALSKIKYKIGGSLIFEATKSVKENGVIVIQ
jgi:hypothetical protein